MARKGRARLRRLVDLVTADLSYLAFGQAIAQLNDLVRIAADADLLGLVKPQFELGLARPPTSAAELEGALAAATSGVETARWTVRGTMESPVLGSRGAIEFLLHAARES